MPRLGQRNPNKGVKISAFRIADTTNRTVNSTTWGIKGPLEGVLTGVKVGDWVEVGLSVHIFPVADVQLCFDVVSFDPNTYNVKQSWAENGPAHLNGTGFGHIGWRQLTATRTYVDSIIFKEIVEDDLVDGNLNLLILARNSGVGGPSEFDELGLRARIIS